MVSVTIAFPFLHRELVTESTEYILKINDFEEYSL